LQETPIDVLHVDNKHVRESQIAKIKHIRETRDKAKVKMVDGNAYGSILGGDSIGTYQRMRFWSW